jgi:hypothetical protein
VTVAAIATGDEEAPNDREDAQGVTHNNTLQWSVERSTAHSPLNGISETDPLQAWVPLLEREYQSATS